MILSNCPRCNEPFRIPLDELPEDAYAQCPWCRDSFPLTEVLKGLPPVLEVMSADGQPIAPSVAAVGLGAGLGGASMGGASDEPAFVIEEEPVEEIVFDSPVSAETVVEDESSDSVEFEPPIDDWEDEAAVDNETVTEETVTEETWNLDDTGAIETEVEHVDFNVQDPNDADEQSGAPITPMKVSPAPMQKKRKSSGIRTAVGIVLGGLASVPIAGGILTVVDKTPDWGFWPFNGESASTPIGSPAPAPQFPAAQTLDSGFGDQDFAAGDPADFALDQIVGKSGETSEEPSIDPPSLVEDQQTDQASEPSLATSDAEAQEEPAFVLPDEASSADLASNESAETAEDPISMPAVEANQVESLKLPLESTTLADPPASETADAEPLESEPESELSPAAPTANPNPATDSTELAAAADRARLMVEAVSAYKGPQDERKRRLLMTYKQIAKACGLATGDGPAIQTLASTIRDSSILGDIESFVGSEWLKSTKRDSDGIALVGQPGENSDGQNLTLSSGKVVKVAGEARFPSADKVLALGQIVDGGSAVQLIFVEPLP